MSGAGGKFREDQVLVICPGSQTTIAQMGVAELSPPQHKFPTRMFHDPETPGDFLPFHTFKRKKQPIPEALANASNSGSNPAAAEEEYEWVEDSDSVEGAVYPIVGGRIVNMKAFLAFLEHVHSSLTTTYHNTPILLMASPQWARDDYETIARYIFEQTKTPSVCMLMSSIATQYGIKWPNMCVVDIGYQKVDCTAIYEYQIVNHKALCTTTSTGEAFTLAGGDAFTHSLLEKLEEKGFNHDMSEQLKKSHICEVLPYAPNSPPEFVELPTEPASGSATAAAEAGTASASAPAAGATGASPENPRVVEPSHSKPAIGIEEENGENGDKGGTEADGVLDVASIVASGQTKEFLAKKEKEKQEKAAKAREKKKAAQEAAAEAAAAAAAAKPTRLPNSRRVKNVFHYEQIVEEEVMVPVLVPKKDREGENKAAAAAEGEGKEVSMGDASAVSPPPPPPAAAAAAAAAAENGSALAPTAASTEGKKEGGGATTEEKKPEEALKAKSPTPEPIMVPERQIKKIRRDIEVGLERFTFATRALIDQLVHLIFETIQGSPEPYMRSQVWENIVFVGNGARLRGLKENVVATLHARHLVSPSTATMFLSELPSNIATPSGTGSQTPVPAGSSFNTPPGPPHQLAGAGTGGGGVGGSGVNPLLQAATTASLQLPNRPGGQGGDTASNAGGEGGSAGVGLMAGFHKSHHSHSQTPTNIRAAALPTYLGEWTKNGYEEAMFLGSLIGARTAFCPAHNVDKDTLECIRGMSLGRVDYNILLPNVKEEKARRDRDVRFQRFDRFVDPVLLIQAVTVMEVLKCRVAKSSAGKAEAEVKVKGEWKV
ncbi:SWI/SNF and RSC complexes subunit arp9 [Zalerion maritima]|uniref:SWI/SNF and RSC complexes subunit arp9 n=1 Tax=Zalerion maritima TaxID=339359 RepID=A0AAD5RMJ6_9PEZI|nr:SWI/SNF and RSC complexes subunit arp9 [Zalerion maritima]